MTTTTASTERHTCTVIRSGSYIECVKIPRDSKMAAGGMHSLAGTVRSLPKLPDYLMQQSERLLQSWIIILYIVTLSIVSVKHCCLQENQNCLYTQADKSHHLLYSKFLNNGLSKIPSKAHERSLLNNSINVISTQLVIVLLLAGDIEVNPGPTPAVNIIGSFIKNMLLADSICWCLENN